MIHPTNAFHTPKDWDELIDWVNRHDEKDRPHLLTAAAMGWNLACKENEHANSIRTQEKTKGDTSEP